MNSMSEYSKWGILSGSLESIATALQSVVAVTSSTRNFVSGCFDCRKNTNSCLKRRDSCSNGAWFDCEQVQMDHPHCYENQVALNLETDRISIPMALNQDSNHVSREQNGIFATTSPPKPGKTSLLRKHKSPELEDLQTPTETRSSEPKQKERKKLDRYKRGLIISSSFAAKLEQDHFGQRNSSLRSEGETLNANFKRSKSGRSNGRKSLRSPVLDRRSLMANKVEWDSQSWDEDSLTSLEEVTGNFNEIWTPNELENAFEIYNSTTLHTFGYLNSIQNRVQSCTKSNSDKFEEIFPHILNYSENVDIQQHNYQDKYLLPISSVKNLPNQNDENSTLVAQIDNKENVPVRENDVKEIAYLELKNIIISFMSAKTIGILDLSQNINNSKNLDCDTIIKYHGKSFNLKLLFDLVKETNNEYKVDYKYSLNFRTEKYPVSNVVNNVISAITFSKNCKAYQLSLLEDVEKLKQKLLFYNNFNASTKVPDEILIENITAENVIKEGKQWQNIATEENEIKTNIWTDIYNSFLDNELSIIENTLIKKYKNI